MMLAALVLVHRPCTHSYRGLPEPPSLRKQWERYRVEFPSDDWEAMMKAMRRGHLAVVPPRAMQR